MSEWEDVAVGSSLVGEDEWEDVAWEDVATGPSVSFDPILPGAPNPESFINTLGHFLNPFENTGSTIADFGSGVLRAGPQIAALGADALMALPKTAYSTITGEPVDRLASIKGVEDQLASVGLERRNSLGQRLGENILPIAPQAKAAQAIFGLGAGGAAYGAENLAPDNPWINLLAPVAGGLAAVKGKGAASSLLDIFSVNRSAPKLAKQVAENLQTVAPALFKDGSTIGDRTAKIVANIDEVAKAEKAAAGAKFEALPDVPVVLDEAIANIRNFVDDKIGLASVSPGSRTASVLRDLENLKPKDTTIVTPSVPGQLPKLPSVVPQPDNFLTTIPGGPAKASLKNVQNMLRDTGKYYRGAEGVDTAILRKTSDELLGAIEKSVPKESLDALKEARSAWKNYKETFEEGAVGSAREGVADVEKKLLTFKNKLLADPKSTQQLVRVMSPDDLENAKAIVIADLVKSSPTSWERAVVNKMDSFRELFGTEGTDNLLKMVGRGGTVGSKLLQDNNGLMSLLSRMGMKAAIGTQVAGPLGMVAAFIPGANKGKQIAMAKSLVMQAAAGSKEAAKVLGMPLKNTGYAPAFKAIQSAVSPLKETEQAPIIKALQETTQIPTTSLKKEEGLLDIFSKPSVITEQPNPIVKGKASVATSTADDPLVIEAKESIRKLKNEQDDLSLDVDLEDAFTPASYQVGSTRKWKQYDDLGVNFQKNIYEPPEIDMGAKAIGPRGKLLESLVQTERKDGRLFSQRQLMAIEDAENLPSGLAFKTTGNKTYLPANKETQDFLSAFGRKQLNREQFENLSVGLKTPVQLNGVDISPYKTPDPPEDWVRLLSEKPLSEESGSAKALALGTLGAAGVVGTVASKALQSKESQENKGVLDIFSLGAGHRQAHGPRKSSMNNFDDALKNVLRFEGGYVNDPDDRGGPTNQGITQKTYNAYRAKNKFPPRSVSKANPDEVKEIYETEYWKKSGADKLPAALAQVHFDTAVLSGPETAVRLLQQALGVEPDGILGEETLSALKADNLDELLSDYLDLREARFKSIAKANPSQAKFLKGWLNRNNKLRGLFV